MKYDEIMQAAKEAGLFTRGNGYYAVCHQTEIERFASIIEKRTIERCALAAIEACTSDLTDAEVIAAIRKLGEQ